MDIINVDDLPVGARPESLDAMLAGANAKANRVAPCLSSGTDAQLDEARLILISAVTRWAESGAGTLTQQTAGPFSISTDTRQGRGYNLWPTEIRALQSICGGRVGAKAFEVDPMTALDSAGLATRPDLWFQWVFPVPPDAP